MADFITAEQRADLVKLYIAYFNRAPEADGLNFHAAKLLADINSGMTAAQALTARADAFYTDALTLGAWTGYTAAMTAEDFVKKVYANVLLRPGEGGDAPSASDIAYWVNELATGSVTRGSIITQFLADQKVLAEHGTAEEKAATAKVMAVLDARLEVALEFSKMEISGELRGEAAHDAGVQALAGVKDAATAAAKIAELAGSANAGDTYTLTNSVDNFVGTSGNDVFRATNAEISAADSINGGAGTDKFEIFLDGGNAAPLTVSNVEQFFVQASGGARTADFNNISGATEIWNNGSSNNLTINNVKEVATVGVKGDIGATQYTVNFADALASGADDSVTIALDGATSTTALRVGGATAANEFENITIDVAGKNSIAGIARTDGGALTGTKAVTIVGDGDLTVTAAIAAAKTIDASAATGAIKVNSAVADVNVTTGSGKDTVTLSHASAANAISNKVKVDLGDGDDTLVLTNLAAAVDIQDGASLKGGAGINTLEVKGNFAASFSALTAAQASKKGFEDFTKLALSDAATDVNAARFGVIDTVTYKSTANGGLSGVASGSTVQLNAANAGNSLAVAVTGAAEAGSTSDELNIVLKGTHAAGTIDYGAITAANVETITLNSTTAKTTALVAADTNTVNLTLVNAQSITVTGDVKAILSGAALTGNALSTIDASENTGGITVSTAGATQGIKITGTSKADDITGGNGNDIIIAGAGDDIIRGGQGNDLIDISGGGSNTIRFEATGALNAKDTIVGFDVGAIAAGGDVLEVSGFGGISAAATLIAVPNLIGGLTLGDNTINIINFNTGIADKDFAGVDFGDIVGGGKVFAAAVADGTEAIWVIQGTDVTHVYHVNEALVGDGSDTIVAGDVTLVGVLEGVTNADAFIAANFG